MDRNISTPVLLSYRRVTTVDYSYNNHNQRSVRVLLEPELSMDIGLNHLKPAIVFTQI